MRKKRLANSSAEWGKDHIHGKGPESKAWWAETIRRCEEAEKHPERMLTAEQFSEQVRAGIERLKARNAKRRSANGRP